MPRIIGKPTVAPGSVSNSIWSLNQQFSLKTMDIWPSIVKNGLVLHLDAAVYASYPGGSTWNDLSGKGNHMTLFNSPAFSKTSGGVLQFNGTNQYGSNSLNYSTTSFTIVAASRYSGAIRGRVISSTSNNWLLGHHGASCEEYYAEGWISDTAVNDTKWRIYAATENYATDQRSFYVNNVLKVSNSTLGAQGFNGLNLGRYGPGNSEYSTCEVGFILVYNRILTRTEMTKIYSFYKKRFGLW